MATTYRASVEATEAVDEAISAKEHVEEVVLPQAEKIRDQIRTVLAADLFGEVLEATLRDAAKRGGWGIP